MQYLEELNPEQRKAVECINGPVMIIAGAGSGKTRVLTYRIIHMLNSGVDGFNILALTFTNKAAQEMKERISHMVGDEARNVMMGTFHSVFARILRMEADKIGYPTNFTIYDTDDAKSVIKNIIKENNLDDAIYKPNSILGRISSAKNSLINWQQYQLSPELMTEDRMARRPMMGKIFEWYTKRCEKSGAMDFDDLLVKMHELLENSPEALAKYQRKFKYILIDEFQDTNFAQYEIIKKLAAVNENIAVVGDDAQSIYAFRGATIANILNFEKDYPDVKTFKLEQNYRSTQHIVKSANSIIENNRAQIKKEIWTENPGGDKVQIVQTASDNEEGRWVADKIFENKMRNRWRNKDFAILYRTNAQSRSFEEALRRLDISYRIYGGLSFYQRKEIKDFIAYLRLTVNWQDEEALRRVINYPARGIGKTTMDRATVAMHETDRTLWEVVANASLYSIKAGKSLEDFVWMIKSFTGMMANTNAYDLAQYIGKQTGLIKELAEDKTVEGVSRYENVQELLNSIKEFTEEVRVNEETGEIVDKSLGSYLQTVSLLTSSEAEEEDEDKVKLMTVHSAKGLEYPCIFVVGMEEELFPSARSVDDRSDLEEERRLFYVAVTRAREKLYLTYALNRYRFGKLMFCDPSRFLTEIPEHFTETSGIRQPKAQEPDAFTRVTSFRSGYTNNAAKNTRPGFANQNRTDYPANRPTQPSAPVRPAASTPTPPPAAVQVPANFVVSPLEAIQAGVNVAHQKFGMGVVESLETAGDQVFANVVFQQLGAKKIMLKFAKLMVMPS